MIDNTPETKFLLEINSIVQTCPLRQLSAQNPYVFLWFVDVFIKRKLLEGFLKHQIAQNPWAFLWFLDVLIKRKLFEGFLKNQSAQNTYVSYDF
jgi:hypothetical protein